MTANGDSTPTKICTKCKECKPATTGFFQSQPRMTCGLSSACKVCVGARRRALSAARDGVPEDERRAREDRALRRRMAAEQNMVIDGGGQKECVHCHSIHAATAEFFVTRVGGKNGLGNHCRECQRAACKSHYERNKDSYHARARAFERANPEWQSRRNKKYREDNFGKILARLRERHGVDHVYRMKRNVSTLIADTLRRSGFTKRSRALEILGCTWDELKRHFERQFLKGMSWGNRELWHIDHIVPIASAITEEDVIRLNHFTNLRPIWAKDNLRKGAQITHLI